MEADDILSKHFSLLKQMNYSELKGYFEEAPESVREFTGTSGRIYRIEIKSSWVDRVNGSLNVRISLDDGGLSAFFPLTKVFTLTRYGGFVGDKNPASRSLFRVPPDIVRGWRGFDLADWGGVTTLVVLFVTLFTLCGIGLFISTRHTGHGDEEYSYTSSAKVGLYLPILSFRKENARWPLNAGELQSYLTKSKFEVNLRPYEMLVFDSNADGSLTVQYSYHAIAGMENGSFVLRAP